MASLSLQQPLLSHTYLWLTDKVEDVVDDDVDVLEVQSICVRIGTWMLLPLLELPARHPGDRRVSIDPIGLLFRRLVWLARESLLETSLP